MSDMSENSKSQFPLCVDLDGTLVNTDTLIESAVLLIKINPLYIFSMLFWLLSGKAYLKEMISARTALDVTTLPYNQALLDWLKQQGSAGRELVLVTAANQRIANAVGTHLGIFSQVIASSSTDNVSASRKRDKLDRLFGKGGYDYAGNSRDDLEVWSSCRRAVVVNASSTVAAGAAKVADVQESFPAAASPWRALLTAMRPHQWSKNLLVFVSLLIAQRYGEIDLLVATILAFVAFCLCSSSVYLINDLLDLKADRKHSEKCHRPFASGQVSLLLGIQTIPVLLVLSIMLAVAAGPMFFSVLLVYFTITLAYSFYFKRLALLDVLMLAVLYTLRILAGAAVAVEIPSVWLVSFSMFLFTSLAMAKRYAELKSLELEAGDMASGRDYKVTDLPIIAQLGVASGYISTLVMALYIDSSDVADIYHHQRVMWLLCPLLMYWIGRIWLLAGRGELNQDPVVFATRDKISYIVFVFGLLTLLAAR
ncbi:Decaprenyl-phosphate phosphoribosyltransferase [Halioglobus japonicus]|nr:Decaprenyl-phosphate phosphoribosyltransferase [Halioglobus japonicus]